MEPVPHSVGRRRQTLLLDRIPLSQHRGYLPGRRDQDEACKPIRPRHGLDRKHCKDMLEQRRCFAVFEGHRVVPPTASLTWPSQGLSEGPAATITYDADPRDQIHIEPFCLPALSKGRFTRSKKAARARMFKLVFRRGRQKAEYDSLWTRGYLRPAPADPQRVQLAIFLRSHGSFGHSDTTRTRIRFWRSLFVTRPSLRIGSSRPVQGKH